MKWIKTHKDGIGEYMVNLNRIDAYDYINANQFIKLKNTDHKDYNSFKMYGSYLKLYINGSEIELSGEEADQVYKILSTKTNKTKG